MIVAEAIERKRQTEEELILGEALSAEERRDLANLVISRLEELQNGRGPRLADLITSFQSLQEERWSKLPEETDSMRVKKEDLAWLTAHLLEETRQVWGRIRGGEFEIHRCQIEAVLVLVVERSWAQIGTGEGKSDVILALAMALEYSITGGQVMLITPFPDQILHNAALVRELLTRLREEVPSLENHQLRPEYWTSLGSRDEEESLVADLTRLHQLRALLDLMLPENAKELSEVNSQIQKSSKSIQAKRSEKSLSSYPAIIMVSPSEAVFGFGGQVKLPLDRRRLSRVVLEEADLLMEEPMPYIISSPEITGDQLAAELALWLLAHQVVDFIDQLPQEYWGRGKISGAYLLKPEAEDEVEQLWQQAQREWEEGIDSYLEDRKKPIEQWARGLLGKIEFEGDLFSKHWPTLKERIINEWRQIRDQWLEEERVFAQEAGPTGEPFRAKDVGWPFSLLPSTLAIIRQWQDGFNYVANPLRPRRPTGWVEGRMRIADPWVRVVLQVWSGKARSEMTFDPDLVGQVIDQTTFPVFLASLRKQGVTVVGVSGTLGQVGARVVAIERWRYQEPRLPEPEILETWEDLVGEVKSRVKNKGVVLVACFSDWEATQLSESLGEEEVVVVTSKTPPEVVKASFDLAREKRRSGENLVLIVAGKAGRTVDLNPERLVILGLPGSESDLYQLAARLRRRKDERVDWSEVIHWLCYRREGPFSLVDDPRLGLGPARVRRINPERVKRLVSRLGKERREAQQRLSLLVELLREVRREFLAHFERALPKAVPEALLLEDDFFLELIRQAFNSPLPWEKLMEQMHAYGAAGFSLGETVASMRRNLREFYRCKLRQWFVPQVEEQEGWALVWFAWPGRQSWRALVFESQGDRGEWQFRGRLSPEADPRRVGIPGLTPEQVEAIVKELKSRYQSTAKSAVELLITSLPIKFESG